MPNHVYVPYGHMMASSEERGENGIRGEEGTFESFFFFITKSEAGSVKRKYLKTWMWVSGCFQLKSQKDKTRRMLRAAAGGRSRRGSRGAGRGRARRSGPLRRLRALPAPRLRDGPTRAGAPEKPPGAGRPRPGNAGGRAGGALARARSAPWRPGRLRLRACRSQQVPEPEGDVPKNGLGRHQGLKVAQPPARRRLPHTMAFNYFFFLFKTL